MSRQDDLDALLNSPGWSAFCAYVTQEWGAGGTRFEGLMDSFANSTVDDAIVVQKMRQAAVARREILRLLAWPKEELARVKPPEPAEPVMSRRGAL